MPEHLTRCRTRKCTYGTTTAIFYYVLVDFWFQATDMCC